MRDSADGLLQDDARAACNQVADDGCGFSSHQQRFQQSRGLIRRDGGQERAAQEAQRRALSGGR